jgi:hypothetical protein
MGRLTFFVKGNVDVHDSLHSCRIGGNLVWNGINEVFRVRRPGSIVRMKHETWTRSDALLRSDGTVPPMLSSRQLPLGVYAASSQFSLALFEASVDAFILSIQPDVSTLLVKHHEEGFLLYPNESEKWSAGDKHWLRTDFDPMGHVELDESMANLGSIIKRIRTRSAAPILVYNMSPIIPGESIHCHRGLGEAFSTRIRRFNLGLIKLSEETGVSIVDVDSLMARNGADSLKLDAVHLKPAGYRLVAEEVVRVLEDTGALDADVP